MLDLFKPGILALIRHTLTTAGGAFVANGYIVSSDSDALVAAIMTILGIGWSIADKFLASKAAR